MYRTKEGDTLSSIAGELMGDSGQWKALYEANKTVISDPDSLPVGVVLKVPQPRMALGQ
jgi:nucleoid-associated protein YgaU